MAKKVLFPIIFILFTIIGGIHGGIEESSNIFFTWLLIGFWISFTLYTLQKIKLIRDDVAKRETLLQNKTIELINRENAVKVLERQNNAALQDLDRKSVDLKLKEQRLQTKQRKAALDNN